VAHALYWSSSVPTQTSELRDLKFISLIDITTKDLTGTGSRFFFVDFATSWSQRCSVVYVPRWGMLDKDQIIWEICILLYKRGHPQTSANENMVLIRSSHLYLDSGSGLSPKFNGTSMCKDMYICDKIFIKIRPLFPKISAKIWKMPYLDMLKNP